MPIDEANIALLIRLRAVVSPDVLKVADMLSEDPEVYSAINSDKNIELEPVLNKAHLNEACILECNCL